MADLTTTQLKLRTTPTAGVSSEQSPYYRRLLSAGYKGFLQGTVGGSTLYGLIGAVIGGLVALPLIATPIGWAALALIPAMAGLGLYKGASTFGSIGSFAAITAESADMNEKRRYLLDRYYDLPATPEHDEEAAQIRELLSKEHEPKIPRKMFHARPLIFGALLGGAIALGFMLIPGAAAFLGAHLFFGEIAATLGPLATAGTVTAVGAGLGALAGGMLGLDRYYVRNWLDKTGSVMHDSRSIQEQMIERERDIQKLSTRGNRIEYREQAPAQPASMKIPVNEPSVAPAREVEESHPNKRPEMPISPHAIAGIETPGTVANAAQHHDRIVSLDEAIRRPVL